MGHRLSKIYTRTGDSGTTGLGDGSRVAKDDLRIDALGDVDELNACIGVLRAQIAVSTIKDKSCWDKSLSLIQHWLFDLGVKSVFQISTCYNQFQSNFLKRKLTG